MNWSCWQGDCLFARGWMETWQRTTVLSSPNGVCILAVVTSYSQIRGFVAVIIVLYLSVSLHPYQDYTAFFSRWITTIHLVYRMCFETFDLTDHYLCLINVTNVSFLILSVFYWLGYYNCPIFFSPLSPSTLHPPSLLLLPLSSCP